MVCGCVVWNYDLWTRNEILLIVRQNTSVHCSNLHSEGIFLFQYCSKGSEALSRCYKGSFHLKNKLFTLILKPMERHSLNFDRYGQYKITLSIKLQEMKIICSHSETTICFHLTRAFFTTNYNHKLLHCSHLPNPYSSQDSDLTGKSLGEMALSDINRYTELNTALSLWHW